MNQSEFEARFTSWQASLGKGIDPAYGDKFDWNNIGNSPLDQRFAELAELYLSSTADQQQFIRDFFADKEDLLWKLILYVRRVAKLIHTRDDLGWLWWGLGLATIESGRVEFPDFLASVVILRFAAERAGINAFPYFNEVLKFSTSKSRERLLLARDHPAWDVRAIINSFGPEEWRKPWWKFWV